MFVESTSSPKQLPNSWCRLVSGVHLVEGGRCSNSTCLAKHFQWCFLLNHTHSQDLAGSQRMSAESTNASPGAGTRLRLFLSFFSTTKVVSAKQFAELRHSHLLSCGFFHTTELIVPAFGDRALPSGSFTLFLFGLFCRPRICFAFPGH